MSSATPLCHRHMRSVSDAVLTSQHEMLACCDVCTQGGNSAVAIGRQLSDLHHVWRESSPAMTSYHCRGGGGGGGGGGGERGRGGGGREGGGGGGGGGGGP